jgi:hypothetical protein
MKFQVLVTILLISSTCSAQLSGASEFNSDSVRIVFYDVARSDGTQRNALIEVNQNDQFWYEACYVDPRHEVAVGCLALSTSKLRNTEFNRDEFNEHFYQILTKKLADRHITSQVFDDATKTYVIVAGVGTILGALFTSRGISGSLRRASGFGAVLALIVGSLEYLSFKIEGWVARREARRALPQDAGHVGKVIDVLPLIFESTQEAIETTGVI